MKNPYSNFGFNFVKGDKMWSINDQPDAKPITPSEAKRQKLQLIPNEVIEAVNELLAEKYSDGDIVLRQNDIIERTLQKMRLTFPNVDRRQLFDEKVLDFEDIFRQAGWKVVYDKPAYNESYEARFIFTPLT